MSRKLNSSLNELQEDEQQESIQWIKTGLGNLEEGMEVETPNVEWFEQMIVVQKEAARKKFLKEVIIFIGIALIIVSSLLFILYQLPIFFFALQGISIVLVIGYSTTSLVKRVGEG